MAGAAAAVLTVALGLSTVLAPLPVAAAAQLPMAAPTQVPTPIPTQTSTPTAAPGQPPAATTEPRPWGVDAAGGPTVVPGVPAPWLLVEGVRAGPGARPVPEAQAQLAGIEAELAATNQAVADHDLAMADLEAEQAAAGEQAAVLADELAMSRRRAQDAAVEAYIRGRDLGGGAVVLHAPDPLAAARRRVLLDAGADATRRRVEDDAVARRQADAAVVELADRLVASRTAREAATARLPALEAARRLAEADLAASRHEADLRAGRVVVRSGDDGRPGPAESGNARGSGWDGLRRCESGGNYAIADASGAYRGAYQFDLQTWRGMGGSGDPAEAPPAEQDLRAQLLFQQRGAQPWPICGAYLLADPALHPPPPPDPDDPANAWLFAPPSTVAGGGGPPGTALRG